MADLSGCIRATHRFLLIINSNTQRDTSWESTRASVAPPTCLSRSFRRRGQRTARPLNGCNYLLIRLDVKLYLFYLKKEKHVANTMVNWICNTTADCCLQPLSRSTELISTSTEWTDLNSLRTTGEIEHYQSKIPGWSISEGCGSKPGLFITDNKVLGHYYSSYVLHGESFLLNTDMLHSLVSFVLSEKNNCAL